MKVIIILMSLFFIILIKLRGQDIITFPSKDSLIITASLYEEDPSYPYIVLFHQAGYSRGEYKETAPKFTNLGYNCLAVDLRSGDNVNSVYNETAKRAKDKKLQTEYLDAKQDMEAAIDYAYNKSKKPVVVVGSSYSASLALVISKNNPKVKAVVAFSPGEYFGKTLNVQNSLKGFDKPVFAACSQREYSYVVALLSNVPENLKTIFKPNEQQGEHGSKSLWTSCPASKEYWLAILMFFNKIK